MIPLRSVLASALFLTAGFAACSEAPVVANATRSIEIPVGGMTCTGCEGAIGSTVLALEGVEKCEASFERAKVLVTYKVALTDEARIAEAIRSVGYDVPPKTDAQADAAHTQSK